MITFQASAAASMKECFYCTEKQTASLSNYDYLAPVILMVCSALYRLFLKGWSQAQIVIKVGFKCSSVSSLLQVCLIEANTKIGKKKEGERVKKAWLS